MEKYHIIYWYSDAIILTKKVLRATCHTQKTNHLKSDLMENILLLICNCH